MIKYDKLVRDKIPEIINEKGSVCITYTIEEKDFRNALIKKLQEEVDEFKLNPCIEELADIMEVVETLAKDLDSEMKTVEECKRKKKIERGGFGKRIFLDSVI